MSIFGMSYGLMTDLGLKVNSETILSQDEMVFFIFTYSSCRLSYTSSASDRSSESEIRTLNS